jgi:signal transduction histidine kinase
VALSVTAVMKLISSNDLKLRETFWYLGDIGKDDYTQTQRYQNNYYMMVTNFSDLTRSLNKSNHENIKTEIRLLFDDVEQSIAYNLQEQYGANLSRDEVWDIFLRDYAWPARDYDSWYTRTDHFNDYEWKIRYDLQDEYYRKLTREETWAAFEKDYQHEIQIIIDNADSFLFWSNWLNANDNIVYYIKLGETVLQNSEYDFEQIKQSYPNHYHDESAGFIFAYKDDYILGHNLNLEQANQDANRLIAFALVWLALYLLCLIYLFYSAGKKPNKSGITLIAIDRLFTEITLALLSLSLYLFVIFIDYYYWLFLRNSEFFKYVTIIVFTVLFTVGYTLLLSIVRHIKNGTVIKNFLLYKFHEQIYKGITTLYSKGNPMLKTAIAITGLGLLTMIPFMGLLTIPAALYLAYRQVKDFIKLKAGIKDVRKGIYSGEIEITGKSEFAALAVDVNEIALGLSDEVERRTKSERLKTELIVNVSHDIRTPLTSLITYADLLSREIENEEIDSENIKKYAGIIAQKSDRLKTLTDDLFESAKAASGNISVNLENVEINALLIQALAEFDEKIKQSSLEFKLFVPQEKVTATADGKLLWRVIENLMSNTIRYSLENSRVYIDVSQDESSVFIEIKNISKAQLNIREDEVTERFKRGDLSRNSQGSGLGLDIASSLMQCQNGSLTVKIDGDLFKVCIKTPKA